MYAIKPPGEMGQFLQQRENKSLFTCCFNGLLPESWSVYKGMLQKPGWYSCCVSPKSCCHTLMLSYSVVIQWYSHLILSYTYIHTWFCHILIFTTVIFFSTLGLGPGPLELGKLATTLEFLDISHFNKPFRLEVCLRYLNNYNNKWMPVLSIGEIKYMVTLHKKNIL